MSRIRINKIIPRSFVDGPGCRTVVFLQGCTLACPGCQNRRLWPADGGRLVEVDDLAVTLALLAGSSKAVTISGGEPFQQPIGLLLLAYRLRQLGLHVLVYSGYTWEEITATITGSRQILENIDILVDGRFVASLDDPLIIWRGSRNQRPIDVQASLNLPQPVVLDWDAPQLVISSGGDIYLPAGLASAFATVGQPASTRMCGQTRS